MATIDSVVPQPGRSPGYIAVNAAIVVLAGGWLIYLIGMQLFADHTGIRVVVYLQVLLLTAVATHRACALLEHVAVRLPWRRIFRFCKYTLWLVMPMIALRVLEPLAHRHVLELVDRERAALIEIVQGAAPRGAGAVTEALADTPDRHYIHTLYLDPASGAYRVHATLPAIDIDGYSASHTSEAGQWTVIHNDDPAARLGEAEDSFEPSPGMIHCRRASSSWACGQAEQ